MDELITFNGSRETDEDYETFYFPRVQDEEGDRIFEFTKTAHRPYDIAVTACLVIIKHHLGDEIQVKSDGDDSQWFDAKLMCCHGFGS